MYCEYDSLHTPVCALWEDNISWTLLRNISSTYDVVDYTYRVRLVAEGRLL